MGKNTSAKTLKILPEVERFDCFEDGISSFHNGNLVLYENYEFLFKRHNALKEAVGKVVEMYRKGEGHVCTHYPSGRRALETLAALVGEEEEK